MFEYQKGDCDYMFYNESFSLIESSIQNMCRYDKCDTLIIEAKTMYRSYMLTRWKNADGGILMEALFLLGIRWCVILHFGFVVSHDVVPLQMLIKSVFE